MGPLKGICKRERNRQLAGDLEGWQDGELTFLLRSVKGLPTIP